MRFGDRLPVSRFADHHVARLAEHGAEQQRHAERRGVGVVRTVQKASTAMPATASVMAASMRRDKAFRAGTSQDKTPRQPECRP